VISRYCVKKKCVKYSIKIYQFSKNIKTNQKINGTEYFPMHGILLYFSFENKISHLSKFSSTSAIFSRVYIVNSFIKYWKPNRLVKKYFIILNTTGFIIKLLQAERMIQITTVRGKNCKNLITMTKSDYSWAKDCP